EGVRRRHEVKVPQRIAALVNEIEMLAARAGDDAHDMFAVERRERVRDAVDGAGLAPKQLAVEIVALLAEPCDLLLRHAGNQVPGAEALPEKILDVVGLGERRTG